MGDDERELLEAVEEAERKIQGILLDLVNNHGAEIIGIEVDTRPLGEMRVAIVVRMRD